MKVKVTTHWKVFTKKPTDAEVSYVRSIFHTEVKSVSIKELANIFSAGRTIACGVHYATDEMNAIREKEKDLPPKQQQKFYISSKTFNQQQVFAVDLDDGNLTLDEIKAKMKAIDIPYAIIYKTLSYCEDDKRWRIVFVNDKIIYSEKDVNAIYTYLIWKLHEGKEYTDSELAKIDLSGTDVARLTFGAKEVVEVNEGATCSLLADAKNEVNQLLADDFFKKVRLAKSKEAQLKKVETSRQKQDKHSKNSNRLPIPAVEKQAITDLAINAYLESLQAEFNSTGVITPVGDSPFDTKKNEASMIGDIGATFEALPIIQGNFSGSSVHSTVNGEAMYKFSLDIKQVYEILCKNLKRLRDDDDDELLPDVLDYTDRYLFIDKIKLTDLLKNDVVTIEENQLFNCLLSHHDDSTPSAKIIPYNSNKDYQFYHCYGCGTTYRTFDFINHIFESYALLEGRQHSTMDTLNLIYKLLDIELGSKYQRRAQKQIKHDKAFIRDLPADSPIAKIFSLKRIFGFYLDLYEIADMKLSYESILNDDEENSIAFIAANGYISRYMARLGHEGSAQSTVNKKLNWMARMGLIQKIAFDDLTAKEKASMLRYKIKTLGKDAVILGKQDGKGFKDKDIFVYKLKPLSDSLLRQVVERFENERKSGCRAKGQSKAQTTAMYGVDVSQSLYLYDDTRHTEVEKKYLKLGKKAIERLLETQGYFTEDDLDKNIDKNRNHFKANEKKRLRENLLPAFVLGFNLKKQRCNKSLRERFNIGTDVKCNIWFIDNLGVK